MDEPDGQALLARFAVAPGGRALAAALAPLDGVYLVGGAVRDLLLGGTPVDCDLAVEGELEPVVARLGAPGRSHDRFGTAALTLDGLAVDLARTRAERYPRPGALPEVRPAPIETDLARRDFTFNAIALGLGGRRRGELLTVPGALGDLRARRLRVLHAASFVDDPTRLLRLARYVARLGADAEPHTRALAVAAVSGGALATVSGARIGAELRLLAAEPDPVAALRALAPFGIDAAIAPGFGLREEDLARRALALLPADGDAATVVLAVAARGVAPATLGALLDELAFTAAARAGILAAATGAAPTAAALAAAGSPSQIAAAAGGAAPELVALAGALGPAAATNAAARWLGELRHVRLEIDGRDLERAGVARGPAVGAGLRAALAARLDGDARGRDAELAVALRAAADSLTR